MRESVVQGDDFAWMVPDPDHEPSPEAVPAGAGPSLVISVNKSANPRRERCSKVRLMNRETRREYGAACGSWACAKCAPVKRSQVIRRLRLGLEMAGRARFLTLSNPALETFEVSTAAATARFAELRRIYHRATGADLQYLGVAERGTKGQRRFHLHFVIRGGPYVPQARWSIWAVRAGFGAVVDIRQVKSQDVASYAAKSLGGYLTKSAGVVWPRHFRRIRVSRRWAPAWVVYKPRTAGEWAYLGMEREETPAEWVRRLARARVLAGPGSGVQVPGASGGSVVGLPN